MPDGEMQGTMKDKYGVEWNVRKAPSGNLTGSLVMPAYGTGTGSDVIAAPNLDALLVEANAYGDDYIKSGGKPPARGSGVTVTASGDNGGAILLVLLLLAALSKGRR